LKAIYLSCYNHPKRSPIPPSSSSGGGGGASFFFYYFFYFPFLSSAFLSSFFSATGAVTAGAVTADAALDTCPPKLKKEEMSFPTKALANSLGQ